MLGELVAMHVQSHKIGGYGDAGPVKPSGNELKNSRDCGIMTQSVFICYLESCSYSIGI